MTIQFSKAGQLSVLGTVIHTGNSSNTLSQVTILKFNNPLAYQLSLAIYKASTATTTLLYSLTLAGGDIVTDELIYSLEIGDQLIATSNIAGTNYYASGADY
jgi:hypothetical protein